MAEVLGGAAAPRAPREAPAHLDHLLSRLNESLDLDAPGSSYRALRDCLVYLLEFFAGLSAAMASSHDKLDDKTRALWKPEASIKDLENLLSRSLSVLATLERPAEEGGASSPRNLSVEHLRGVFFVGSTTGKPSPRRHARMLRVSGSPIAGYQFLSDWAEQPPTSRDAFAGAVKRYLPILKDWVTGTQSFFAATRILEQTVSAQGFQTIALELDGKRLELGPAIRVKECSLCAASVPKKVVKTVKKVVARSEATSAPTAAAVAGAAAGSPVVKTVRKVLVVKRPDGTIVKRVVTTAPSTAVATRAAPAASPPETGGPPAKPSLVSPISEEPSNGSDSAAGTVRTRTVVKKVAKPAQPRPPEVDAPRAGLLSPAVSEVKAEVVKARTADSDPQTGSPAAELETVPAAELETVPNAAELETGSPAAELETVPTAAELETVLPAAEAPTRPLAAAETVADPAPPLPEETRMAAASATLPSDPAPVETDGEPGKTGTIVAEVDANGTAGGPPLTQAPALVPVEVPGEPAEALPASALAAEDAGEAPSTVDGETARNASESAGDGAGGVTPAPDEQPAKAEEPPAEELAEAGEPPPAKELAEAAEQAEGPPAVVGLISPQSVAEEAGALLLGPPAEEEEVLEEVLEEAEVAEELEEEEGLSLAGFKAPKVPYGVPEHFKHITDHLTVSLDSNELYAAAADVQAAWSFLIRYFGGVLVLNWRSQVKKLPDDVRRLMAGWARLGLCRELLCVGVNQLADLEQDSLTTALRASFFRPSGPCSHTVRLRENGPDLVRWSRRSLEGDQDGALEALGVYLNELREWLDASSSYFEGCEHFAEPPSADGKLEVVAQFGDAFLELCEPDYAVQIRQCPVCLPVLKSRAETEALEQEAAPELAELLYGAPLGSPDLGGVGVLEGAAEDAGADVGLTFAPAEPLPSSPGPAPPAKGGLARRKAAVEAGPSGLDAPEGCPEHLVHILDRVSYGQKMQDSKETCLAVRDALEFLVRYFAGVAGLAARKFGVLPAEAETEWTGGRLSVSRCERILYHSLQGLAGRNDSLAQEIRKVFFGLPGGDAHTRTLTLDVEKRLRALGKFCMQTQSGWDKVRCIRENSRFLPVLKDWLNASAPFFKSFETLTEPAGEDGQMDVVVQFKDDFLEMVPPDYHFLIRRCPVCLPVYKGGDPPVMDEEDEAPAPRPTPVGPQAEGEAPAAPRSSRRLDSALEDLLRGLTPAARVGEEGSAPAAEEGPAQEEEEEEQVGGWQEEEAPRVRPSFLGESEDEPAMAHDISLLGTSKTPDGRIQHGGYINVVNVGGGVLSATVRATHPCITVTPVRFKGQNQRIQYTIDEADLPTTKKVYVVIRTPTEERQIPVWQMLPRESTLAMPNLTLKALMLGPSFLYAMLVMIIHSVTVRNVNQILEHAVGKVNPVQVLQAKLEPAVSGSLANAAQFDASVFVGFSGLVPMLVAWLFSLAPPDQQHRLRKWYLAALVLPLILVSVVVMVAPTVINRPELKPMNFQHMFLWFFFLNGFTATFFYVRGMGELNQWLGDPFMRKFITVCVGVLYFLMAMLAVIMS